MKKILLMVALLASCLAAAGQVHSNAPKVLLVVSSDGRDAGKTQPGFEMGEYAHAYLVLKANGLQVEVASPAGGLVEADPFNVDKDHIQAILADVNAQHWLKNTRRTRDIKPGEYQAIMIIGGKGAMFDLPKDEALQQLLAAHYLQGGILAAVCHGPAAFAQVKLADGKLLVAGRRMTGFTDEEETTFGKKWLSKLPFLLESKMRSLGAQWEEAPLMMPKLVADGRLITGQNPFSTSQTAEAIVRALGRTPVTRSLFMEEASMQLVERWVAGDQARVQAILKADPGKYKTELIAMLGIHHFKSAKDAAAQQQALSIMLLAEPHMSRPILALTIAEAHIALGDGKLARQKIDGVLARHPDSADAKKLLASLPTN